MKSIIIKTALARLFSRNLLLCAFVCILASCERLLMDAPSNQATQENAVVFDALWKAFDERYTMFEFKRLDWNAMRTKYRPQALAAKSNDELFRVMGAMVLELQDDHTSLLSRTEYLRFHPFSSENTNFDSDILERVYLKQTPFRTGLVYTVLERSGKKYGYFRYESFLSGNLGLWGKMLEEFRAANIEGMIIDIRNNGGGDSDNALFIASRIMAGTAAQDVMTEMTKKGVARNDYNPPKNLSLSPAEPRYADKRVAVLTNRNSYSASSLFAAMLKAPGFDHVRLIGDHTGGGSGIPVDYELPNGWIAKCSGTKMLIPKGRISREQALAVSSVVNFDAEWEYGFNYEAGVPVDIKVNMNLSDRSKDAIIERAVEYINSGR